MVFIRYFGNIQESIKWSRLACAERALAPPGYWFNRHMAWAFDSITNPPLNDRSGAIVTLPGRVNRTHCETVTSTKCVSLDTRGYRRLADDPAQSPGYRFPQWIRLLA